MKTIGTPPHIHDHLQFSVIVKREAQKSERQLLKTKVGLVGRVEDGSVGGWFNTEGRKALKN